MKRRKLIIAVSLIVILAIGAWVFGLFGGTDPALAELQQMAEQAFDDSLPNAQRDQLRDEFRDRMQSLSDDQRETFFNSNRDRWMQRAEERMDEFFSLPPAEQQERLDDILDRMSQPRNDRPRSNGDDQANRGGGPGQGDWGSMTEAQRDERAKRRLDHTSPKMRAQFAEFRKKLEDRAKERGIPQPPGWGFPGGRRG